MIYHRQTDCPLANYYYILIHLYLRNNNNGAIAIAKRKLGLKLAGRNLAVACSWGTKFERVTTSTSLRILGGWRW